MRSNERRPELWASRNDLPSNQEDSLTHQIKLPATKIGEVRVSLKGNHSLSLTLPANWAKQRGIKPGDIFEVFAGITHHSKNRVAYSLKRRGDA